MFLVPTFAAAISFPFVRAGDGDILRESADVARSYPRGPARFTKVGWVSLRKASIIDTVGRGIVALRRANKEK